MGLAADAAAAAVAAQHQYSVVMTNPVTSSYSLLMITPTLDTRY